MEHILAKTGGRKFFMGLLSMAAIVYGGHMATGSAGFAGVYAIYVGGILGVLGVFGTINVGNKWVTNATGASDPQPTPPVSK